MENKYYNHFDFYNLKSTKNFVLLEKFKTFQQTTEYTCAPACAKMVLNYYNNFDYNEMQMKVKMNTNAEYGTKLKNMIKFFTGAGYQTESSLDFSKSTNLCFETFGAFKKYILKQLKNKNAVIVENVDYGGHYKVIIGYDEVNNDEKQDIIIFADPYDRNDGLIDGYNYFPADRFFNMWFDNDCLVGDEKVQPFLTVFNPKNFQ